MSLWRSPLIQLKDIKLTFGGTPLLSGVELSVSTAERVCLIGRNGSGKSTLLKIAAGLVEPDSGSRFVQPGATVRYLPQEPDFTGFATTLAYVEAGMAPGDDHYQARYVLEQLGLHGDEDPAHVSGGRSAPRRAGAGAGAGARYPACWTSRPTTSISPPSNGWKANSEAAAARSSSSAMTAAFCPTCRARPRGSIAARSGRSTAASALSKPGATRCWRRKSAISTSSTARSSTKSIGCDTACLAAASVTSSDSATSMNCASNAATIAAPPAMPIWAAAEADKSGKLIIEAKGIGRSYGDRKIVDDFSIRVQRGDRIGIVGPNGAGKTTLIEMLTGGKLPDSGTIRFGANIEMATLDQHRESLDPKSTLGRRLDRWR